MIALGILAWIILGLIAGAIARLLIPGKQPGGLITTILLGIGGAILGGYIGNVLTDTGISGINITSIILAVIGAVIIIFIWAAIFGRR
ncbi:MAG: GlsB/YeaQ/YmgE family stress response membrane protein [Candidatus Aquicultor sp.]